MERCSDGTASEQPERIGSTRNRALEQLKELEQSINAVECDTVVLGTPSDISKMIRIRRPLARVRFEAVEVGRRKLESVLCANRSPPMTALA